MLAGENRQRWRLASDKGRLKLFDLDKPEQRPLWIDFATPALQRRCRAGKNGLLGRAFGLHLGECPQILDATAGLGGDAFVLARLGCPVQLLERQPQIAALLEDALQRARKADNKTRAAAQRMRVSQRDAIEYLQLPDGTDFDAIYLDPMFDDGPRKALNKKELRILHALAGDDTDAPGLLNAARQVARRRVVVKRRRLAAPLGDAPASYSLSGTALRFDIYLQ